jgi:hypothetical protein
VIRTYSQRRDRFDRCLLANMDPRRPFELEYPGVEARASTSGCGTCAATACTASRTSSSSPVSAAPRCRRRLPGARDGRRPQRRSRFTLVPTRGPPPPRRSSPSGPPASTRPLPCSTTSCGDSAKRARRAARSKRCWPTPDDAACSRPARRRSTRSLPGTGKLNQHLHQTYEDEDAWETMLAGQVRYLLDVIDYPARP